MEYLTLYSPEQSRRHEVRPGITGWAQVNGRNALGWSDEFKLDVWYVNNRSLWLDIKILWLTVRKVLLREGISAGGEATMPKFTGSKPDSAYSNVLNNSSTGSEWWRSIKVFWIREKEVNK